MSPQYKKLIALLKELFQLDQPDLDFGIYRILHARSEEITAPLQVRLIEADFHRLMFENA